MRVKKLLLATLSALLLISAVGSIMPVSSEPQPRIYLDPATIVANPGETFTVEIKVEDVTNLNAWEIKLKWDVNVLEFPPEVEEGDFLSNVGSTQLQVTTTMMFQTIQIGVSLLEEAGASGSGTLAILTFKVLDSGNCTLDLYDTKLFDIGGYSIDHTTDDGYFYSSTPVATFTIEPAVWHATPINQYWGDVGTQTFNASACYDPDGGTIVSYEWDFGDGTTGEGMVVSHTYTEYRSEPYIVTLTVTDDDGESWSHSEELKIYRDIAIVDIWPTDTIYWEEVITEARVGFVFNIIVTATNLGTVDETLNVTLYADKDTTTIGDEINLGAIEVTVPAGQGSGWALIWVWRGTRQALL